MGELKRIVVEHYPAADLPDQFRGGIDPTRRVTVTVAEEPEVPETQEPKYLRYWGKAAHLNTSAEEAVARIRVLRDEWD